MKLILASSSPRRATLLADAGFSFDIVASCVDECLDLSKSPEENSRIIALRKADAVGAGYHDRTILAADTIVALGDTIIGKPEDKEDARNILASLSGREHKVITGVAIVNVSEEIRWVHAETSTVTFSAVSAKMIAAYVETREPMDKAGGYAIQGGAKSWIARYEGSYSNIVGLPMERLGEAFARFGITGVKSEGVN